MALVFPLLSLSVVVNSLNSPLIRTDTVCSNRQSSNTNGNGGTQGQGPFMIGSQAGYLGYLYGATPPAFNGAMTELIGFDGVLSASDQLNVQSYLAIKYGITLATPIYSLSNDTVYNSTVYTSCIAGLANDTASALDQKVSRSVNDSAIVTMSTSSDFVSGNEATSRAGTSLPKNSSIVWGNDGNPNTLMNNTAAMPAPTGYIRLGRVWNVQTKNNSSAVDLQVNTYNTNYKIATRDTVYYVLWDKGGSGNWASATPVLMTKTSDSTYVASGISFQNGDLFTFAQKEKGSWVGVNPTLWLRADADIYSDRAASTKANEGDDIYNWIDVIHADSATQRQYHAPTYHDQGSYMYNFHPVVHFENNPGDSATIQNLAYSRPIITSAGSNGMTWLAVTKPKKPTTSPKTVPLIYDTGTPNWIAGSPTYSLGCGMGYGSDDVYSYLPGDKNYQRWVVHSRGTLPTLVTQQIAFTSQVKIYANGNSLLITNPIDPALNSLNTTNLNYSDTSTSNTGPFTIGSQSASGSGVVNGTMNSNNGRGFLGDLPELIGFDGMLDAVQLTNAQSYLALKYGITLSPALYTLRGDTVWKTTGTYDNGIAGLVRNDLAQLDQRVSQSTTDTTAIVTMSTNGDFTSINSAASRPQWADSTSLIWGNNGDPDPLMKNNATVVAPAGYRRLARVWNVQTTHNPSAVDLQVNNKNPNYTISIRDTLYLLWNQGGTGNWASATLVKLVKTSDSTSSVSGIAFKNGDLFTFAQKEKGSWVGVNPALWLRADADVYSDRGASTKAVNGNDVYNWIDVVHSDSARQQSALAPQYRDQPSDYYNFNPVLYFDNNSTNSAAYHNLAYSRYIFTAPGSDGMTWFAVVRPVKTTVDAIFPYIMQFGQALTAWSPTKTTQLSNSEKGYGFGYGYGNNSVNNMILQSSASANSVGQNVTKTNPVLVTTNHRFGKYSDMSINGDSIFSQPLTLAATAYSPSNIAYSPVTAVNSGPVTIGSRASSTTAGRGLSFRGAIAEVIGFDGVLNSAQRSNAESYLALKYGLTVHQNYTLRNAVVWDTTGGYNQDIAGLVRNDTSMIDQRVSRSVNADAVVTMATSNDFISLNTDPSRTQWPNQTSLIWGNDSIADTTYHNDPMIQAPMGYARLARTWKVQTTGNPGTVNIQINTNNPNYNIETPATPLFLVLANGLSFSNGTPIPMTQTSSGIYEASNVTLSNGQLFSFATGVMNYEFDINNIDTIREADTLLTLHLLVQGPIPTTGPIVIDFNYSGNADWTSDYGITSTSITIPVGDYSTAQSLPFTVQINNDGSPDSTKRIIITVNPNSSTVLPADIDHDGVAKDTSTIDILDGAAVVQLKVQTFVAGSKKITEGSAAAKVIASWKDGQARFRPATLALNLPGIGLHPASPADWILKTTGGVLLTNPYSMTIPIGQVADTFLLYAINDSIFEGPEKLGIVGTMSPNIYGDSLKPKGDTITIVDAQQNVVVSLSTERDSVNEGDSVWVKTSLPLGITTADTIKVFLDHPTTGTSNPLVRKNIDYTLVDTLLILPGHHQDSVWMRAILDNVAEPDELVHGAANMITTGPKLNTLANFINVTIMDMNKVRDAQVIMDNHYVQEGGWIHAHLELQNGLVTPQDLYFVFDLDAGVRVGNAITNVDYTVEDGMGNVRNSLMIPAGTGISDTFYIHALNDNLYEPTETILMTNLNVPLSSPAAKTFNITPLPDTAWILNVDTTGGIPNTHPDVNFSIVADTLYESEYTQVTATLPGVTIAQDTVQFAITYDGKLSTAPQTRYTLDTVLYILPGRHSGTQRLRIPVNPTAFGPQILYLGLTTADTSLHIVNAPDSVVVLDVIGVTLNVDTTDVKEGGRIAIYGSVDQGSGFDTTIYVDLAQIGGSATYQATDILDYDLTKADGVTPFTRLTLNKKSTTTDTVYMNAKLDNLYEPMETLYMKGTLSILGGGTPYTAPMLLGSPLEMHIYNVDTTGGVFSDTTWFDLIVGKNQVNEGDSTRLWVSLPGTETAEYGTQINLTHPGPYPMNKAKINVDYTLGNVLTIPAGGRVSDSLVFKAKYDNIFEHVERVEVTGNIPDANGSLSNDKDTLYIHNVDTVGGVNMVDSIYVTLSESRDTLSALEMDTLRLKLPGTTIYAADGLSSLDFTMRKLSGDIVLKSENPLDYDLEMSVGNVVSIFPGANSGYILGTAMDNNTLDTVRSMEYTVDSKDTSTFVHPLPDTTYIINSNQRAGNNLLTLSTVNGITDINKGDTLGIFVLVDNGNVAGQDIPITLAHPIAGSTALFGAGAGYDYTLGYNFLIPKGQVSSDTIWLIANKNQIIEPTKSVIMKGACNLFPSTQFADSATVYISSTAVPAVQLDFSRDSVREGDSVWVIASFMNGITDAAAYDITVSRTSGTASTADYRFATNNVITIAPYQTSDSIKIYVLKDSLYEGFEHLKMHGAMGDALARDGYTKVDSLVLIDADANALGGADLLLTSYPDTITEGRSGALVLSFVDPLVRTSKLLTVDLNHNMYMGSDSATNGLDYTLGTTIKLPVNAYRDTAIIAALPDNLVEHVERVTVDGAETRTMDTLTNKVHDFYIKDSIPIPVITLTTTLSKDTMMTIGDSIWVKVSLPDTLLAGFDISVPIRDLGTGTAVPIADYYWPSTTVTIFAGTYADSILVFPNAAASFFTDRSVIIDAIDTVGFKMISPIDTFYIHSMTPPQISLSFALDSVLEGNDVWIRASFLNGVTDIKDYAVTVLPSFSAANRLDTAIRADYRFLTDSIITIKAGQTSDSIQVHLINDSLYEGFEQLNVIGAMGDLSAKDGYTNVDSTVLIDANANALGGADLLLTSYPDTITEGRSGALVLSFVDPLVRTSKLLTVNLNHNMYAGLDSATNGLDYTLGTTIQLPVNAYSDTAIIAALPDHLVEHVERVTVDGAETRTVDTLTNKVHDFYIKDSIPIPVITLTTTLSKDTMMTIGDSIWVKVSLPDTLLAGFDISVPIRDLGTGTAVPIADYYWPDTTVTISAGTYADSILVFPNAAASFFTDRSVIIDAIDTVGFKMITPIDTFYIHSMTPPQISLSFALDSVLEGNDVWIRASFLNGVTDIKDYAVTVLPSFSAANRLDTAIRADYKFVTDSIITIKAGQTSDSIQVHIINDKLYEGFETLKAIGAMGDLSAKDGYTNVDSTVLIDADANALGGADLLLTSYPDTITEGRSGALILSFVDPLVSTSKLLTVDLNHNRYMGSDAATNGLDYTLGTTIQLPVNAYSDTAIIAALPDNLVEHVERVTVDGAETRTMDTLTNKVHDFYIRDSIPISVITLTTTLSKDTMMTIGDSIWVKVSLPDTLLAGFDISVQLHDGGTGTAVQGTDYYWTNTTVTIFAGTMADSILVFPNPNTSFFDVRSVIFDAIDTVGFNMITPMDTFYIRSATTPQVDLSIAKDSVLEGNDVWIRASFQNGVTNINPYTITVLPSGGTATTGADYSFLTNNVITILPGRTSDSIQVHIINDHLYEGFEQLKVIGAMGNAAGVDGSTNVDSTVLIDANANALGGADLLLTSYPDTITEGRSGALVLSFVDPLVSTSKLLTVDLNHNRYMGSDAATNGLDYTLGTTIQLPVNASSDTTLIYAIPDNLVEHVERVTVDGVETRTVDTLTNKVHDFYIKDSIPIPVITLTTTLSKDTMMTIGDSIWVKVSLPDTLLAGFDISVQLHDGGTGTAVQGTDYYWTNTTVTIYKGTMADSILVFPNPNTSFFDARSVIFDAIDTVGFNMITPVDTFYIRSATTPQVDLSIAKDSVLEGNDVWIRASFQNGVTNINPYTITVLPSGGTATTGADYSFLTNNVITILPGRTSDSIQVHIINDHLYEGFEQLKVIGAMGNAAGVDGSTNVDSTVLIDANANALGGADLLLTSYPDTITEGRSGALVLSFVDPLVSTSKLLTVDLNHNRYMGSDSATNGLDYTLGTTIQLPVNAYRDTAIIAALPDNLVEHVERVTVDGVETRTVDTLTNKVHDFYIKDSIPIPVITLTTTLSKDTMMTIGDSIWVKVSLPDTLLAGFDISVQLHDGGTGTAVQGTDYYWTNTTVTIFAGTMADSILVFPNPATGYDGVAKSVIFDAIDTVGFKMIAPMDTFYIVDARTKEVINAYDFAWPLDQLSQLDDQAARVASGVNGTDIDGNAIPQSGFSVDAVQLAAIHGAVSNSVFDLAFYTPDGKPDTVQVTVYSTDTLSIDTLNQEVIGASSFVWPLSDAPQLDTLQAKDASDLFAFDLTQTGDVATRGEIPRALLQVDVPQLRTIQGAGTVGAYPLRFATPRGSLTQVEVLLLGNDTTVINPKKQEAIGANNFSWSMDSLSYLDDAAARIASQVMVLHFDNTVDNVNTIVVDAVQLAAIQNATVVQNYPLTFTSVAGSQVTVWVTLKDGALRIPPFQLHAIITIDPHTGCAYDPPRCSLDEPYAVPKYYGMDTMKNNASIEINLGALTPPVNNWKGFISYRSDPSGDNLEGAYSGDTSFVITSNADVPKFFLLNRLDTLADLEGTLWVHVTIANQSDSLAIRFSNDFDGDGIINSVERTTCIKYTNGVYNEWYYTAPDGDADGDGISNIVEAHNRMDSLYLIDSNGNCIPDFMDEDSNGDGVPDSNEKFHPNKADSNDIYVRQAVSPNGDRLGDDQLFIENINKYSENEVTIFSRTGKILYKVKNYDNHDRAFNGYPDRGAIYKRVPMGTYYYFITYVNNITKERREKSGFIEIRY